MTTYLCLPPPAVPLSFSLVFRTLTIYKKILFDFNVEHFRRLPTKETHKIEDPETLQTLRRSTSDLH